MKGTRTFWLDRTGQVARAMRRYSTAQRTRSGLPMNCTGGFHRAIIWIDRETARIDFDKDGTKILREPTQFADDDPGWPRLCDFCQYVFTPQDRKQTFYDEIYRAADGREFVIHPSLAPKDAPSAPPGAMWHSYWLPSAWRGDDGIALTVRLPNGNDWLVDSRANNCDQPDRPHKCWIRHGDPRTGEVTVDKQGDSCHAGAGSIQSGNFHGFLSGGLLFPV